MFPPTPCLTVQWWCLFQGSLYEDGTGKWRSKTTFISRHLVFFGVVQTRPGFTCLQVGRRAGRGGVEQGVGVGDGGCGPESRYQGKNQSKTPARRFPRDATAIASDPGRIYEDPRDGTSSGFPGWRGRRDFRGLPEGQGPVKGEALAWTGGTRVHRT